MLVKCTRDDVGWWTVDRVYNTIPDEAGFIRVGDDEEPHATGTSWLGYPVEHDPETNIWTYALGGLDGDVEFKEVEPS